MVNIGVYDIHVKGQDNFYILRDLTIPFDVALIGLFSYCTSFVGYLYDDSCYVYKSVNRNNEGQWFEGTFETDLDMSKKFYLLTVSDVWYNRTSDEIIPNTNLCMKFLEVDANLFSAKVLMNLCATLSVL